MQSQTYTGGHEKNGATFSPALHTHTHTLKTVFQCCRLSIMNNTKLTPVCVSYSPIHTENTKRYQKFSFSRQLVLNNSKSTIWMFRKLFNKHLFSHYWIIIIITWLSNRFSSVYCNILYRHVCMYLCTPMCFWIT